MIEARVIADSVSRVSPRLTTFLLTYPRFIHPQVLTHRVFSRNASSSRAIPTEKLIQDVINEPVIPLHWGRNRAGMQADEECAETVNGKSREQAWLEARDAAVAQARAFAKAGYHKQIVNRLIEPFAHIHVVLSGTEFTNWNELRDHDDAQPEVTALARNMVTAMDMSKPALLTPGQWHLPFVDPGEGQNLTEKLVISTARCARASYMTFEGKRSSYESDLRIWQKLHTAPMHASPFEHQAQVDDRFGSDFVNEHLRGNFCRGWVQHRKLIGDRRNAA